MQFYSYALTTGLFLLLFSAGAVAQDSLDTDLTASELYERGLEFREQDTPEGYRMAAKYFQRAIEKDAEFARAYAQLGTIYTLMGGSAEMTSRALKTIEKALSLNSELPEAHIAMGLMREILRYEWSEAAEHFRTALEMAPNNREAHREYGWLLIRTGQLEAGLEQMREAHELAPETTLGNDALGVGYFYNQQYQNAIDQFDEVLEIDPSYGLAHLLQARAYTLIGEYDQAEQSFQNAASHLGWDFFSSAEAGYLYARSGQSDGARQIIEDLRTEWDNGEPVAYDIAVVYAGLKEGENVLTWLERAYDEGTIALDIKVDPRFEFVRMHPRFNALLKKMNLTEEQLSQPTTEDEEQ